MVRVGSDGAIDALRRALLAAIDGVPEAARFASSLEALAVPVAGAAEPASDEALPVLHHLREALAQPGPPAARAAADALDLLGPALTWAQNPGYVAQPPDPTFLARYGYAVVAGPATGPRPCIVDEELAFGVLLLGPGTTYPTHVHPAAELYLPLGIASWSIGRGPLVERPAGTTIVHDPHVPHATRTGTTPLAALYVWIGSLDVDATIVRAGITRP